MEDKKIKLLIPTSWEEVTLGEFIKLSNLDIKEFKNVIDYYINVLMVFGNENLEDIFEYLKKEDIVNISNQMNFMNTQIPKEDITEVVINKIKYKFISNLNNITIGEYVSIETLIEKDNLNSIEAIPIILSVLLRPENEVFDSNLCESRMELFKNELSIVDVLKMSDFFLIGGK